MRAYFISFCALVALVGCRNQPYVNAHIESVNAEYRQLEDYVYSLEEENARLQQEIDAFKTLGPTGTTPSGSASPGRSNLPRRQPSTLPRLQSPARDGAPS